MDHPRADFELRTILTNWRTALHGITDAGLAEPWLTARIHDHAILLLDRLEQLNSEDRELRKQIVDARVEVKRAMAAERGTSGRAAS